MGQDRELRRLEGKMDHQGGWRQTPFGDPLEYKCITLWCVYRYDWTGPEDSYHYGPPNTHAVWVYTTEEEAHKVAALLNSTEFMIRGHLPGGGERGPWGVHPAAVVKHGDEGEAEEWLRNAGLIN